MGVTATATALVAVCCLLDACASIPSREHGVRSLSIAGMDQLDETALKVCLATQEREHFGPMLSVAGDPECSMPPFDATRLPVSLWTWPWTEWPLYDETVWNRDIARVARWYRARGFYDARVSRVSPRFDEDDHTVRLSLKVEENQPVLVEHIELVGLGVADRDTRDELSASLSLRVGERFDEALHDESKRALVEVLRERAYALATVEGTVSIDTERHAARVKYHVVPGRRFRFGKITVEGEESLPERPVWAAAEIESGQPFSVSAIDDAKRAIYELGPFASVEVVEKPQTSDDRVDLVIKVVPGRKFRTAIGAGMQVGTDPTLAPTDVNNSLNRWDLHLLGRIEHRNFLGGMRRISIEDRPRLLFNNTYFPRAINPHLGNLLILDFRQPSFLEARTSLGINTRWDRGPDPYTNVLRDDILASAGPERTFLGGTLRASVTINGNWFFPDASESAFSDLQTDRVYFPSYYAMYMQYALTLDLRDAPREPKRGMYFAVAVQHAGYFLPSDWNYIRVTPDVRGYVPLWRGFVLAGRVRLGVLEITQSDIDVANDQFGIKQRLHDLGPLRQRLRGGGNNSVRGYRPNALGDVTQIGNNVVDSGGLRQWEASLELRAPITSTFGAVLFVDVGDVSREKRFRLNAPQTSIGLGLRYRTIIGPIRLDVAFAPRVLQAIGSDPRIREAYFQGAGLLPYPEASPFGPRGSIHFTIGEAY
ncbi:MAG: BamA/TamA family outer membrane protein [Polyangiales bacterium]